MIDRDFEPSANTYVCSPIISESFIVCVRINVEKTSSGTLTSAAPLSTPNSSVIAPFISTGTTNMPPSCFSGTAIRDDGFGDCADEFATVGDTGAIGAVAGGGAANFGEDSSAGDAVATFGGIFDFVSGGLASSAVICGGGGGGGNNFSIVPLVQLVAASCAACTNFFESFSSAFIFPLSELAA